MSLHLLITYNKQICCDKRKIIHALLTPFYYMVLQVFFY